MAENEQDPALTCPPLPLERILGYNGKVKNGLHIVEGEKYPSILFPLGSACIKERSNFARTDQTKTLINSVALYKGTPHRSVTLGLGLILIRV